MSLLMITPPEKHYVLVVDDEPDVHSITRLSLRGLRSHEREVEFLFAASGTETVQIMQAHPEVAVILLDVVMETTSAGLDACRAIRNDLGNRCVRILLRTGQPGAAPERETIDAYDIDGYLPKAELTTNRLYVAVRTAIKAWEELVELERHRHYLTAIHDCVVTLRSFEPLEVTLGRILDTAVAICPASLAILDLHTFDQQGNPRRWFLYQSTHADAGQARAAASAAASRIAQDPAIQSRRTSGQIDNGFLVPLVLHRELGYGWIYLEQATLDDLTRQMLPLLAEHAANALYAGAAQSMLASREGSIYDTMTI
jgi:CheY-like chemotaxis protein